MKKEIICTVCPMGCVITVEGENGNIDSISGFTCQRGKNYAEHEFVSPVRILTSTAKLENANCPLVAVRSKTPVPKDKLFDCMAEIRKLTVKAPVKRGDVLIENVCETGVDIVSSADVK